jgi:enamine deaminase RidA (YjgF/YER057c/UK114 family)
MIHGDLFHIGHFGGIFDVDGEFLTSIEEQTLQTFHNLGRALHEINLSPRNLLKVTVILRDICDFQGMHNA